MAHTTLYYQGDKVKIFIFDVKNLTLTNTLNDEIIQGCHSQWLENSLINFLTIPIELNFLDLKKVIQAVLEFF